MVYVVCVFSKTNIKSTRRCGGASEVNVSRAFHLGNSSEPPEATLHGHWSSNISGTMLSILRKARLKDKEMRILML